MPHLFSYGTLRQSEVQLATFGRTLVGRADDLPGYRAALLKIEDADVVAASGKTHHPIATFTGDPADCIGGTVFEITDAELIEADRYEVAAYKRVQATLASGTRAWVYVDAATDLTR